jgi:hypothetical protein
MRALKHSLLASLLVVGVTFGTGASAADDAGNFSVQGGATCSKYLSEQSSKSVVFTSYMGWVAGYMSAYNSLTPDTFSILGNSDLGGALLWIKGYCEKNPLDTVAQGMQALIWELYPKRLQKAP